MNLEDKLNLIELNCILYYADYLSLKERSIPITDTCTYFFIHKSPINSSYIAKVKPIFSIDNKYYEQSFKEYNLIKSSLGDEEVSSFIEDICSLGACGKVNAYDMLKRIHRYSTRGERNKAFKKYNAWKDSIKYYMKEVDENGKQYDTECSQYVAHQNAAKGIYSRSNLES